MGVQFTAVSNARLVESGLDNDRSLDLTGAYPWPVKGYEKRSGEFVKGWYAGEVLRGPAFSYSGYRAWREWLAALVDVTPEQVWDTHQAGPFSELIDFSDCEGMLGTEVCAKLAKDFADHADLADGRGYDAEVYQHMRRCFNAGAKAGFVKLG